MISTVDLSYRVVHAFVLLMIGVVSVSIIHLYVTGVSVCGVLARTGQPCLLCGCTRDVVGLFVRGEMPWRNVLSLPILVGAGLEVGWRVYGLFRRVSWREMCVDGVIHGVVIALFVYANHEVNRRAFEALGV